MGGVGSGRKPDIVKNILNNLKNEKPMPSNNMGDYILPNHSGIAVHPEFKNFLSNNYLKLDCSNDPLTNDLDFSALKGINKAYFIKLADKDNDLPGTQTINFASENYNNSVTWVGNSTTNTALRFLLTSLSGTSRDFTFPDKNGTFAMTDDVYTSSDFDNDFASKDTDDLSEGSTNLYYTDARAESAIATEDAYLKNTGDTATGTLNTQDLLPRTNNTYDLGSGTFAWNDLHVDNQIFMKPTGSQSPRIFIDVDAEFNANTATNLMNFKADATTSTDSSFGILRGLNAEMVDNVASKTAGFIYLEPVRTKTFNDTIITGGTATRKQAPIQALTSGYLITGGSGNVSQVGVEVNLGTTLNLGSGTSTDWCFKSNTGDVEFGGTGNLILNSSNMWVANGTGTVTISNVAPSGVGTATISKWLKATDNTGTVYYLAAWT